MRNRVLVQLWIGWLLILAGSTAWADEVWRARTTIDVPAPGLVESVVPPELVLGPESGEMDLTLTGPDGHARAFELYWREPVAETALTLSPSRVSLDERNGFVWEATLPERLLSRQLLVRLSGKEVVGRIDVDGYRQGRWTRLVDDAAVFDTDGVRHSRIDLPQGQYERLRLSLTGFDPRAKEKLSPVRSVTLTAERIGKDFAGQVLALPFQQSETRSEIVVQAALPGSGLWLKSVTLATEAQFQGRWQIGRETIVDGQKRFITHRSGHVAHVDHRQQLLTIDLNTRWPGRSLVLRLDTDQRYIGAVTRLTADARLPRLVFSAEKTGRYTLLAGTGRNVRVLRQPGDALRQPDMLLTAAPPEANILWRPASLVERFHLKGAPFQPAGYTWRAPVQISDPGFFSLALSLEALLDQRAGTVRIVKDDLQVPFIRGREEIQTMPVTAQPDFDAEKNQGRWTIQLPGPSAHWQRLTLNAQGIFRRTIHWERPKPANMGWERIGTDTWENRDNGRTALNFNLNRLPAGTDRLRVVMDNGDNQPIALTKITARYATPTVLFLAHQSGTYWVCGGNPEAGSPHYDLSLVENQLLSALPGHVAMGALEPFQSPGWGRRFSDAFKESGWGLYAVLGLVTLVLIGIIVRLFPKGEDHANGQ